MSKMSSIKRSFGSRTSRLFVTTLGGGPLSSFEASLTSKVSTLLEKTVGGLVENVTPPVPLPGDRGVAVNHW
jgi:hypothetical protein